MGKINKELEAAIEKGRKRIRGEEPLNDFCKEPPCASPACRRTGKCLHSS